MIWKSCLNGNQFLLGSRLEKDPGIVYLCFFWRHKFYISENLECRVEKWLKFCSIFKLFLKICIKLKILRNYKHNPINPIWNQNCKNILDYVKIFKQTFIRDSNTCFSALIIWNNKFGWVEQRQKFVLIFFIFQHIFYINFLVSQEYHSFLFGLNLKI